MTSKRSIRVTALLGALGALIAVVADVPTLYTTSGAEGLVHVGQLGRVEGLDPLLLSKSSGDLLVGHALALVGQPLAIFGIWAVYRAIRPAGRRLALTTLFAGIYGHLVGTVLHAAYPFVAVGLQVRANAPEGAGPVSDGLVTQLNLYFEPLGTIALGGLVVAMAAFVYAVATRETAYPRWLAVANPGVFLLVFHAVAFVSPTPLRVFLIVAGLNLSLLAFYSLSAYLLWTRDLELLDGQGE